MEPANSSAILVTVYKTPLYEKPGGHNLNFHNTEYPKSHKIIDEFVGNTLCSFV
jgi:hypothetical protein